MSNFDNKYKDNTPVQTIENIKYFFESYNYNIEESTVDNHYNLFWYCIINLYKNNILLLSVQGKGITRDFCRASGYAELYERFCSGIEFYDNILISKSIQNLKFKKYGYYFSPDEKELDFKEIKTQLKYTEWNKFSDYPKIINQLCGNNKFIGIPFTNLNQINDKKYFNLPIYFQFAGSNGMAAGNTLEESIVQGISELLERDVIVKLDKINQRPLIKLNNNNLSEHLKYLINIIEQNNNKVIILDLSYSYNLPVVACIIINKINKNNTIFWRCHPVFELAVEGAITECFQRIEEINSNKFLFIKHDLLSQFSINHKQFNLQNLLESNNDINIFDETLFINAEEKDYYNTTIFLESREYSNVYLLDYYKNLLNRQGINIYYYDSSIIENIKAVIIYSPQLNYLSNTNINTNKNLSNSIIIYQLLDNLMNYNPINITNDTNLWDEIFHFIPIVNIFKFRYWENNKKLIKIIQEKNIEQLYKFIIYFTKPDNKLIKYISLYNFKTNNYSKEQALEIFNFVDDTFDENDWLNCDNFNFIIKYLIKEQMPELYSEDNIKIMYKGYIYGKNNI